MSQSTHTMDLNSSDSSLSCNSYKPLPEARSVSNSEDPEARMAQLEQEMKRIQEELQQQEIYRKQEEMKHHASKKMPFITNKNSVNDADLIRAFRERVEVTNRMYRLKKYKKCFVGSEAVDVLAELTGKSRKEALLIGINLGVNLFEHVTDPSTHPVLEDSYIFFRFLKWTEFSSGGRRQL